MMTTHDGMFTQRWLTRQVPGPLLYRLLVVAAVVVCGLLYLRALAVARAADGTDGFTLLLAASPLAAVATVVGITVLAVAVALAVTVTGRAGTAVIVVAASLAFAAAAGGSVEQWLRQADGTRLYWFFAAEMLTWATLWLAIVLAVYHFNAWLLKLAPERAEGVAEGAAEVPATAWWGAADAMEGRSGAGAELIAGAVCVAIGSIGVAVLVQTATTAQVMWGVGLSYLIAGLMAHQVSPVRSPIVFVLSPLAAGLGWYLFIAMQDAGQTTTLYNYFTSQFWPAGLVMPGHYASAGVAGAMLGRAWSQGMLRQHWLGMEAG